MLIVCTYLKGVHILRIFIFFKFSTNDKMFNFYWWGHYMCNPKPLQVFLLHHCLLINNTMTMLASKYLCIQWSHEALLFVSLNVYFWIRLMWDVEQHLYILGFKKISIWAFLMKSALQINKVLFSFFIYLVLKTKLMLVI